MSLKHISNILIVIFFTKDPDTVKISLMRYSLSHQVTSNPKMMMDNCCFCERRTSKTYKTQEQVPRTFLNISNKTYLKCQCKTDYIGRTGQTLEARIRQYLKSNIHNGLVENFRRCVNTTGSEMSEHLQKTAM